MNPQKNKTKNRLIKEMEVLQKHVRELEDIENERKQAEEALESSLQQQRLLTEVSYLFTKLRKFEKNMNNILRLIGEYTKVSRVYIFEDFNKGEYTKNTYEWCNKNIEPQIDNLQEIPYTIIPSWKKILIEKGMVFSTNISELPQDLLDILEPQKIKSILVLPIYVRNKFFGFLGFDECEKHRIWDNSEIELIKTIANIISTIFERKQAEEKTKEISKLEKKRLKELEASYEQLQKSQEASFNLMEDLSREMTERKETEISLKKSEERFRILFEYAPDAYLLNDLKGIFIDGNRAAEQLTGYKREELIGKTYFETKILGKNQFRKALKLLAINIMGEPTGPDEFIFRGKNNRKVVIELLTHPVTIKDKKLVLGIARDISRRKKAEEKAEASAKKLRDLARHLQTVREQERTNIAREMHDELGQLTTALKMDIVWIKNRISGEPLTEKLQAMSDLADVTIKAVKRISSELRPGILDDLGLQAAMEWFFNEFEKRTGIQCRLDITPRNIEVDPDRTTAVYRIFQETLTNVARHARASSVKAILKKDKNILTLRISDNGIGIAPEKIADPGSYGLIGIQERAISFNGEMKITGKKGKGTTVVVTLPLVKDEVRRSK
jgi:PAS domain S-box-containing protein